MKKYKKTITLIIVFIITIIGCVYALKWHSVYKNNMLKDTIITNYINELKKEEITNYISENPNAVIYFGVAGNDNCRRFENALKKYVLKNNFQETIVYINLSEIDGDNFKEELDRLYNTKSLREKNKYFDEVPAVAVYDHTTLIDFVSGDDLKIEEVDALLSKYNFNGE